METNPNFNAVLIAAIAVVSALVAAVPSILTTFLTYKAQMRKANEIGATAQAAVDVTVQGNTKHDEKLDKVHEISNGRLTAALDRIAELEAKVAAQEPK